MAAYAGVVAHVTFRLDVLGVNAFKPPRDDKSAGTIHTRKERRPRSRPSPNRLLYCQRGPDVVHLFVHPGR